MDKILERHDDVGVIATILYIDFGEGFIYKDPELTEGLTKKEFADIACKPLILKQGDIITYPSTINIEKGEMYITMDDRSRKCIDWVDGGK